MATTALPSRSIGGNRRWAIAGAIVILAAILAALLITFAPQPPSGATTGATTSVTRGSIVATVGGTGSIAAAHSLELAFETSGAVVEVLVAEGDRVTAGQPLARLDTRDLELQVAGAQAALVSARTRLEQIAAGNVKPTEIEASEASVASAEAQLRSAQAQLAALRNPGPSQISAAELTLRQAEIDLQSTRDNSSATKTKAEQDLQRAVATLTQAQSQYATARSNWEWVQAEGTDPLNPTATGADGRSERNTLSDGQMQQYYDSFVQAEAALRSAEQAVAQAEVTLDNARQSEIASVARAEAKVADAQTQLAALTNPTATDIAQAQASVAQAQAALDQARANLANLTAPGTQSDIAIQQASVAQAEQTLRQAELRLEQATLRAPFAGIVTQVYVVPGSVAGGAAVSLIDRDPLHIDLRLSENDVARIAVGQPVELTIDALRDWSAAGVVGYISPAAETSSGVVTYRVRVDIPDTDERVKIGMTANVTITTATKEDVLLVPNAALLPKGAGRVVQAPIADGGVREVDVETGLTDGTQTEIVSGLSEGDTIIATPGIERTPASPSFLP